MESKTISELSEEGRCHEYNNEKERQIIRLEEKLKKYYQQMDDYEADIQDLEMQLGMMELDKVVVVNLWKRDRAFSASSY